MTTTIALVPISIEEKDKKNIFDPLTSHLASIFDASITILTDLPQLDSFRVLFNKQRNQLNSDKLLHWLATSIVNHIKSYDAGKTIILAMAFYLAPFFQIMAFSPFVIRWCVDGIFICYSAPCLERVFPNNAFDRLLVDCTNSRCARL
jgi:hypothetical protein